MMRRPSTSVSQMPSHDASALKQGVDRDWWRKTSASASSNARVSSCTCALSNALRSGERLVSPSAARSAGGRGLFIARRNLFDLPWQRVRLRIGEAFHRFLYAFLVAQSRVLDAAEGRELEAITRDLAHVDGADVELRHASGDV